MRAVVASREIVGGKQQSAERHKLKTVFEFVLGHDCITAGDSFEHAGAFQASRAWRGLNNDSWFNIACLERMVELGEIIELSPLGIFAQNKIYAKKHYNEENT